MPIAALVDRPYGEADLRAHLERIREVIAKGDYPHPLDEDVAALKSELSTLIRGFVWAPAHVVYDDPASIGDPSRRVMHTLLFQRFERLQTELLIESAYFIPLDRGVAKLKELVDRGVRVRVLTNSLASNDVIAAFAGYSKRRDALVRSGVELHELRPEPGPVRKRLFGGGSKAGLHTKAIVFDRKDVFIGSFNLDARSSAINTEAGLYVESPALAEQVIHFMNEGVDPDVSFRLELDKEGKLSWVAEDDGTPLRYDKDPMSTFLQRFAARPHPPVAGRFSALAASPSAPPLVRPWSYRRIDGGGRHFVPWCTVEQGIEQALHPAGAGAVSHPLVALVAHPRRGTRTQTRSEEAHHQAKGKHMKRAVTMLSAFAVVCALALPGWAQTRTLPTQTVTIAGTIETIDQGKRAMNIKTADGNFVAVNVPATVQRFNELKVGDKIKATYNNNVMVR